MAGEAVFPVDTLRNAVQSAVTDASGVRSAHVRSPIVSAISTSGSVHLALTTVQAAAAVDAFTQHVLTLVRGAAGRKDLMEKLFADDVTAMFAACSRANLNACLQALDATTLPVLFGKKERSNTSLLAHLYRKRADDFDLPTKFNIINLTQRDAAAREKQELIVVLFEATHGKDLFVLKDQLDVDNTTILNMSRCVLADTNLTSQ